MSKRCVAFSLILAAILPAALLAADDADWKPESEEAAVKILENGRKSLGELCRFEIECLGNNVDKSFEVEERTRLWIYCEESVGYTFTVSPLEPALMQTSRRSLDGRPYLVRSDCSKTWLMADGLCTVVDENRRTYEVVKADPNNWILGSMMSTDALHRFIPPWLDSNVDWGDLKARFQIQRARSTATIFFVEFTPLVERPEWRSGDDDRLRGHHRISIDRKTLRPTKWWTQDESGHEQTFVYTRFDANAPRRELKISLAGYKDVNTLPKPSPKEDPKPAINTASLEVGARILFWLLF
jgi:hypothetical protein